MAVLNLGTFLKREIFAAISNFYFWRKRLQINTDLLLIIRNTIDKLSGECRKRVSSAFSRF